MALAERPKPPPRLTQGEKRGSEEVAEDEPSPSPEPPVPEQPLAPLELPDPHAPREVGLTLEWAMQADTKKLLETYRQAPDQAPIISAGLAPKLGDIQQADRRVSRHIDAIYAKNWIKALTPNPETRDARLGEFKIDEGWSASRARRPTTEWKEAELAKFWHWLDKKDLTKGSYRAVAADYHEKMVAKQVGLPKGYEKLLPQIDAEQKKRRSKRKTKPKPKPRERKRTTERAARRVVEPVPVQVISRSGRSLTSRVPEVQSADLIKYEKAFREKMARFHHNTKDLHAQVPLMNARDMWKKHFLAPMQRSLEQLRGSASKDLAQKWDWNEETVPIAQIYLGPLQNWRDGPLVQGSRGFTVTKARGLLTKAALHGATKPKKGRPVIKQEPEPSPPPPAPAPADLSRQVREDKAKALLRRAQAAIGASPAPVPTPPEPLEIDAAEGLIAPEQKPGPLEMDWEDLTMEPPAGEEFGPQRRRPRAKKPERPMSPIPDILSGIVKPEPSPPPEPEVLAERDVPDSPRPEPAKPEPEPEDEKAPPPAFQAPRSPKPEHYEGWEYAASVPSDLQSLLAQMPGLEPPEEDEADRKLFRSLMMQSGPGSNYLNPINLTGIPLHQQSNHRTAVMAHSVPQRPMFEAEDVNVTDLVHRFQSMEMPSRAHMVRAASHIRGHIMENMWEDVNMGQRRARERHGRRGPFAKRRGRSRVMSKTANVQGRSRGKLYETTIRRKVTPYELELVMKKLRLHLESGVGSVLFMHFGRTRQLVGDLTDIDLEDLKRRIRKKLERHPVVGIELADARVGGALHHPRTHSAQFTRTLL